jgi:hypothetical protein
MIGLGRRRRSARNSAIRTREGVEVRAGLRVHHARLGDGTVLRVVAQDAVVVRWDGQLSEPSRTTFVAPVALVALTEPRVAA